MPEDFLTIQDARNVLRRRAILPGQRALYKALYEAWPQRLSHAELAATMLRKPNRLNALIMSLENRIKRTLTLTSSHADRSFFIDRDQDLETKVITYQMLDSCDLGEGHIRRSC